jgi:asparagine synthase (glutamine-hydrolysing)
VSGIIGTEHHEVVVGMDDFFNALPKLIWHEDEPITWPSSVSLNFVSRLAAQEVKVVLTGEGSDELFAGYGRYRFYLLNRKWMDRYRMVPGPIRRWARSAVETSRLLSASQRRKLRHTFIGCGEDVESLYIDNFYSAFGAGEQSRFRDPGLSPYASFFKYWNSRPNLSPLSRMLYADQKTYLVELLMKQDRMSMATSIESRVPLLDHEFVEFSTRVPDRMKLRGATGKYIFKKAVEDVLPHDILYRKKMGFPTPLRAWLRAPEASGLLAMLRSRDGLLDSLLDARAVDDLLERHTGGIEDATDRIWRLLNLQLWGDIFITGKRAVSDEPLIAAACLR